jgi:hypothetical protein
MLTDVLVVFCWGNPLQSIYSKVSAVNKALTEYSWQSEGEKPGTSTGVLSDSSS